MPREALELAPPQVLEALVLVLPNTGSGSCDFGCFVVFPHDVRSTSRGCYGLLLFPYGLFWVGF